MVPILFEDNHCLAVDKPAGLLSQRDETGDVSLVDLAREDLKNRFLKPGNVYIGLVHRLDRTVSGVVLLAKTSKAAARLSAQFQDHTIGKTYWAVVDQFPAIEDGTWLDTLQKDARTNIVRVVEDPHQGQVAGLAFRVLGRGSWGCLVELRPTTGRGHQLRVQLASRGAPIIGDRKYGSRSVLRALDGGNRIALHARELRFTHPTTKAEISVRSEVPGDWPRLARPD